jgi:hypothetical protein
MTENRTILDYLGIIATACVVAYLLAEWVA